MGMKALLGSFILLCAAGTLAYAASGAAPRGRQPSLLDRPRATPAQLKVLDRLLGTWDVRVTVRAPFPGTVTYAETYAWVLDRQFLRGETTVKSDGTQDFSMTTFDAAAGSYHVWVFTTSTGAYELPLGTWDAQTQSMDWTSGPNTQLSFTSRWTFPDVNTRRWTARLKDWKGQVIIDLDGTCIRRR
jgi:hypothetical protein